ncbi:MAG: hypothetical protein IJW14_01660 [Oscillospiraceae bacterium]|nr:hypothetical protein [Oscillospiraceae bacterium]
MQRTKLMISLREILYIFAAVLVIFEIYLMELVNVLRYTDEIIAVLCLAKILSVALRKGLDRMHIYMLLLMLLLLSLGLVSTYDKRLQLNWKAILTDIGNTFKVFVTYIGASLYLKPVGSKKRIVSVLATVIRVFVLVLFGFMLLHFAGIYVQGNDVRYGLKSFQFINRGAGQLSLMFYALLTLQTVDLRYSKRKNKKLVFIGLTLLVWLTTLRTRAFMYALIYIVLYWLIIVKDYKITLNWKTALLLVAVLYILSADQIDLYFNSPKNARAYFVRFGIYTMQGYFPLGSGFATYGTDAAVVYYSRLYYYFGFHKVWGLSPSNPIFAHDTYWPAIMAQFGFFGMIIMLLIVFCWARDLIMKAKNNKFAYLAALFICITQISASIATATFFHFVTVGIFFLLPLLFEEDQKTLEGREPDETSNGLYPNLQPSQRPVSRI